MDLEEVMAALEAGKTGEARDGLLAVVETNPHAARAWLLLAGVATSSGDWQLGALAFGALVALRPLDSLASSGSVDCLANLGRSPEAPAEIDRFVLRADDQRPNHRLVPE